jgi:hypothetical protein
MAKQKIERIGLIRASALAVVLALLLFLILRMDTPGWWFTTWRASLVKDPDVRAIFLFSFAVDSALCLSMILGLSSLRKQVSAESEAGKIGRRSRNPLRRFGVVKATVLCAVPMSLYATCAAVEVYGQRLSRSAVGLVTWFLGSLAVFLVVICGWYVLASWPNETSRTSD